MDARHNTDAIERLATLPRIRQRSAEWIAAQPSKRLNYAIGTAWLGFLYTIGLFSAPTANPESAAPLGFMDSFAALMFFVTLGGIFTVINFAIRNRAATAPVSIVCGLAVIVVGATCGFVGHPISAWAPDAVLATAIVAGSAFVMARRESIEA